MKLIPYLAGIVLVTITFFTIVLVLGDPTFTIYSFVIITINICFILIGIWFVKRLDRSHSKPMFVITIATYIALVGINIMTARFYFPLLNHFAIVYQFTAINFFLLPVIYSLQQWMNSDIELAKITFFLERNKQFDAELLSETQKGDFIVRILDEPQNEYWVNRDVVKMIRMDTPRKRSKK